MASKQKYGKPPTFGGLLLQHLIVFLICIAFPGVVTLVAPATWIRMERSGDQVQCTTYTCMFFALPFKIQQVDHVSGIAQRERAGRTEKQRKHGRTTNRTVHVDGEGFLQIQGVDQQAIEISVSPASLDKVVAKCNDFLESTEASSTTFAIANWKFGGLMGGLLTTFTILYVVGYTLGFLKWIFIGLKKLFSFATPQP